MDDGRDRKRTGEPGAAGSSGGGGSLYEEFRVRSEDAVAKIKELLREGNVRRILVKNEEGKTLLELPLTVGVVGTLLLPFWAALGTAAALVANLTIAVERRAEEPARGPGPASDTPSAPRPAGEDEMRGDDVNS